MTIDESCAGYDGDLWAPNGPRGWKWVPVDETTHSGKQLFRCSRCGILSPTPDKWRYHGKWCHPLKEVGTNAK